MSAVPNHTTVLVIGGGPAGSTAASALTREGIDVTLFERETFPRYHIGESALPASLELLDVLGAREKIEAHGFQVKYGATYDWGKDYWTIDFGRVSGGPKHSLQVKRSEFDQILLEHSKELGARVFEATEITGLDLEDGRPCRAHWKRGDERGTITFDQLVDASGSAGLLATRCLRNRKLHDTFRNVAIWAYFEGAERQVVREGDVLSGAVDDGWVWAIPLHDGTTSFGFVMHREAFRSHPDRAEPLKLLMEAIEAQPTAKKILGAGTRVSEVRVAQDYSYSAESFAGPGWFLAGDSACFLDPLFATGLHFAIYAAFVASACIAGILQGDIDEAEAARFYERSYRRTFLRFLVFVSGLYGQYRAEGASQLFWEGQKLTPRDYSADSMGQAFVQLITGMEDLQDAGDAALNDAVLSEVSSSIRRNLEFAQVHHAGGMTPEQAAQAKANVDFLSALRSSMSMTEDKAVDGLYVQTVPRLRLVRAAAG